MIELSVKEDFQYLFYFDNKKIICIDFFGFYSGISLLYKTRIVIYIYIYIYLSKDQDVNHYFFSGKIEEDHFIDISQELKDNEV